MMTLKSNTKQVLLLIFQEIVTKQIGDQSHTVTRRRDESGNEETQEDLVNIAQGVPLETIWSLMHPSVIIWLVEWQ